MFIADIDYYKKAIKYPDMLTEKQLESINDLYNKLCGYAKYENKTMVVDIPNHLVAIVLLHYVLRLS